MKRWAVALAALTLAGATSSVAVASTKTPSDGKQPPGIILDARKYFKHGSPPYVVADFVYVDHWNTTVGVLTWDDVLPGQGAEAFTNDDPMGWYVTDGVEIDQVTYQSSTLASVKAKLALTKGVENSFTMHQFQAENSIKINTTFKLKKIGSRWWISNINDIAKQL